MSMFRRFETDNACRKKSFCTGTVPEMLQVTRTTFGQFLKMKVNQTIRHKVKLLIEKW